MDPSLQEPLCGGASERKGTSHIFSSQPLLFAALGPDAVAWKPGRTQAEKHPQDDLGAYLGRELPGLLVTSLPDMYSLPTPSGLQQCQLPGQAPQKGTAAAGTFVAMGTGTTGPTSGSD